MLKKYFDKTVNIERKTTTDNGFGGTSETWETYLPIPCLIDYLSGKETQIASQYADKATHILMTNAGYEIIEADRVNDNGEIYRILHVDEPFGKQAEILLEYVGTDNV